MIDAASTDMLVLPGARSAAQLQDWLRRILPLYAYIELSVDDWGENLQCSVPLSANNRNHLGNLHAGVQWSLAETLGGIAYFAHVDELGECVVVVREVGIRFLKPATTAIRARARFGAAELEAVRAELEARGKAEYTLDIELLDLHDVVVSRATGCYHLRRRGSGSKP